MRRYRIRYRGRVWEWEGDLAPEEFQRSLPPGVQVVGVESCAAPAPLVPFSKKALLEGFEGNWDWRRTRR